jgi:hypothetical protein
VRSITIPSRLLADVPVYQRAPICCRTSSKSLR